MRMKTRLLSVVAAVALLGASAARAQTTAAATASITIGTVLYLNVTNTNVAFSGPVGADFAAGSIAANSPASVVEHAGNVTHDVEVQAGTAFFDAVNAANDGVKPSTDLEWSADGGTTWTGLSTTPADVATAAAPGSYTGTGAETVDYRMLLDYTTDAPDTYTLNFTYTVVAN